MSGAVSEDQGSVKSEDSLTGRSKFLCSYGGRIMPRPHDSQLRYVGGETRILSVRRNVSFADLMTKLKKLCPFENVILKYQLPNEDLDALVSVISDEDLENMMEEFDRLEAKDSNSRLRLFLFPVAVKQESDPEHKFVDAVNGVYRKLNAVPESVVEEQKKIGGGNFVLMQPSPGAVIDKAQQLISPQYVPVVAGPSVMPLQASTTSQVAATSHITPSPLPAGAVASHNLVRVPPLVPSRILAAPPPSSVLRVAAGAGAQMVGTQTFPQVVAGAQTQTYPQVVTGTQTAAVIPQVVAATQTASGIPQVVAGTQTATVIPQVIAGRPVVPQIVSSRPLPPSTYVPLMEVSRGFLPKGVVLRQLPVEDDHSDSTSQTSLVNSERRYSGENVIDARRVVDPSQMALADFEKLRFVDKPQENVILQHIPEAKIIRSDMLEVTPKTSGPQFQDRHVVLGGGQAKLPEAHLERYLVEQTMAETGTGVQAALTTHPQVPGEAKRVHEQEAIPRAVSAPVLQSVDPHHYHPQQQQQQFHRFSDRSEPQLHHQENTVPNVRACIGPGDVIMQLEERFPTPVLHPLNGLRSQQISDQTTSLVDPQLVQKPVKVVPQVVAVNPFKVP